MRYVVQNPTAERPGRTYDVVGELVSAGRTFLVIQDRAGVLHGVPVAAIVCVHPHDAPAPPVTHHG